MSEKEKLETYGVKVSAETKQRITDLIQESGLTAREFMESLLTTYEADKLTQADATALKEIQQLEHHLNRIKEIFVEKAKTIDDQRQQFAGLLEEADYKHAQATENVSVNLKVPHNNN